MRTGGEVRGVFQFSSMTLGAKRVQRAQWESGALALSKEGKERQSRAEIGLTVGGEEISGKVTIRLLCLSRTQSGGRHDSAERIGIGIKWKQLATHLCTRRK